MGILVRSKGAARAEVSLSRQAGSLAAGSCVASGALQRPRSFKSSNLFLGCPHRRSVRRSAASSRRHHSANRNVRAALRSQLRVFAGRFIMSGARECELARQLRILQAECAWDLLLSSAKCLLANGFRSAVELREAKFSDLEQVAEVAPDVIALIKSLIRKANTTGNSGIVQCSCARARHGSLRR